MNMELPFSNNKILVMLFYSAVTFFVTPYFFDKILTGSFAKGNLSKGTFATAYSFAKDHPDIVGCTIGFIVSIILWINFGKDFSEQPSLL